MTKNTKPKSKKFRRLKQIFGKVAVAGITGLTMLGLAASVELSGYNFFDTEDGRNILCDIDPSCRPLTDKEILLARTFFDDQIDYKRVRIFNRPWMGIPFKGWYPVPGKSSTDTDGNKRLINIKLINIKMNRYDIDDNARSPNGHIYFNAEEYAPDFTQKKPSDGSYASALLYRKKLFFHEMTHVYQYQTDPETISKFVSSFLKSDFNYRSLYHYDIDEIENFNDLNLEQQAEVVEDFMGRVFDYQERPHRDKVHRLKKYAEILSPHFPNVPVLMKELGISTDNKKSATMQYAERRDSSSRPRIAP